MKKNIRKLALVMLVTGTDPLTARARYRLMVAVANAGARLGTDVAAGLVGGMVTLALALLVKRRPPRKVRLVQALAPVGPPQPVEMEVKPAAAVVLPPRQVADTASVFVAMPRSDRRRKGVSFTYKPYVGQALKQGQHLAVREGRRYRPVRSATGGRTDVEHPGQAGQLEDIEHERSHTCQTELAA